MVAAKRCHVKEETINALTHGLGALLGAGGLTVLVVKAVLHGDAWQLVSCSIYGATLVLLFSSSTLYHSFRSRRVKHVFRIIDHASIYLLIAGTYTPFVLVNLRGQWGWSLFAVIWGLALAGIVFQVFFVDRFRLAQTLIYLAMGWMVVVAVKPLFAHVPRGRLAVVAGRRLVLHGGRGLLSVEEAALPPRCLASLRPGRQRLPLFRDFALCVALIREGTRKTK